MVSAKFDPDANALYLKFLEEDMKIEKTIPLGEGTYLEVTNTNIPIGIELILPKTLSLEAKIPLSKLAMTT